MSGPGGSAPIFCWGPEIYGAPISNRPIILNYKLMIANFRKPQILLLTILRLLLWHLYDEGNWPMEFLHVKHSVRHNHAEIGPHQASPILLKTLRSKTSTRTTATVKISAFKETTVYRPLCLILVACLMTPKPSSFSKTTLVSG